MFGTFKEAIAIINSLLDEHLKAQHARKENGNPIVVHTLIKTREAIQIAWDEQEKAFSEWAEVEKYNLDNYDLSEEIEQ